VNGRGKFGAVKWPHGKKGKKMLKMWPFRKLFIFQAKSELQSQFPQRWWFLKFNMKFAVNGCSETSRLI
jgi:hypothetical protein